MIPGYISAISFGYLFIGSNMLVQFILTPMYLNFLGEEQFGLLMLLLSIINFLAIGITWMSGGLVRILGEYWAKSNILGFKNSFVLGKYVFTLYSCLIVFFGIILWLILDDQKNIEKVKLDILLASIYLIIYYENLPGRQAFVGINQQSTGSIIEFLRVIFFGLLVFFLLPYFKDISVVWISLIIGVCCERIITGYYWKKYVGVFGWMKFSSDMRPLLKRLVGKQGFGYMIYGMLVLASQADAMVIGLIGGVEAVGKFVLLWKIPSAIIVLLWKVSAALKPRVVQLDAQGKIDKIKEIYISGRKWYYLLVLLISSFYILSGKWLTELWVGQFAPSENWMYIVSGVALFFSLLSRWPISFSHALIKLPELNKVASFELIGKVTFTIMLYPYFNIASPAVGLIIIHLIYVAYAYQNLMLTK